MAGGNPKTSSHNNPPPPSSHHRKSRWESGTKPSTNPKPTAGTTSSAADAKPPAKAPSNPKEKPTPQAAPATNPKAPTADTVPRSLPGPIPPAAPFSDAANLGPPPPPTYGFHMLDRRTVALADGTVRTYFALPPDYQDFPPRVRPGDPSGRFLHPGHGGGGPDPRGWGFDKRGPPPNGGFSPEGFSDRDRNDPLGRGRAQDYWSSFEGRGAGDGSLKRKFAGDSEPARVRGSGGEEKDSGKDEFFRQKQQPFLPHPNAGAMANGLAGGGRVEYFAGTSNPYMQNVGDTNRGGDTRSSKFMRVTDCFDNVGLSKHLSVDPDALKKAFLHFAKLVNENASQRKVYLADGKQGRLQCAACGRSSKDFPDMHGLIMHTYNSDNADLLLDHLGLHKSLCILMGWSHLKPPDNSKSYQFLSADAAAENQDDLIMWPPVVIIHNTMTGKGKDGRPEGLGNKAMDSKLRDLGFGVGKSKSLYSREGHLGITLVKFSSDISGLNEAKRLSEFFEKENHGRKGWAHVQPSLGKDDEKNPNLVQVDQKTGEKRRIFYGYLGTASDLDIVDFETRKKVVIESAREVKPTH